MSNQPAEQDSGSAQLAQAYSLMMDPEVRGMLRANPEAAVKELESRGHSILDGLDGVEEIKVITGTEGKMYIPLPRIEQNYSLSGDELERIHASGGVMGIGTSTVSSVSSAGSLSSITGSLSSISSAGSLGSVDT
ncbi:MAG: hypothetical protein ACR2P7_02320 [bacterium]